MGVSTHDIFGDAGSAQPATPGSYGEAPSGYRLPEGTRLGRVRLQIADLARSLAYYEGTLGLRVLRRDGSSALLGPQGADTPLVELHERAGVRAVPRRSRTGLFHFAILLPDRPSLGRLVRHLGEIGERVGSADHLVSESLYLQDPDNFGIEVFALAAEARVREHKAEGRISIHMLSGHIQLKASGRMFNLRSGGLLALDHGVSHDVHALEESALLLTIAWPGRT